MCSQKLAFSTLFRYTLQNRRKKISRNLQYWKNYNIFAKKLGIRLLTFKQIHYERIKRYKNRKELTGSIRW